MPQVQQLNPIAVAYARSLLELAAETGSEVKIGEELEGIGQVLTENRTFVLFLKDPSISGDERARMVRSIFGGRLSPLLLNTLLVMNNHRRLRYLPELVDAYDALLDVKLGKVEVDVTVAAKLSAAELEEVRQLVNHALKKDAVVHQYVDESIIGGLVLKVGDRLIDGSVRTQLESLREKLLVAKPR